MDPNWPVKLYIWAWLLPLISFALLVLGGKRWGRAGAFVALGAIVGSFGLSTYGLILYTKQFSPDFFKGSTSASHSDEHGAAPQSAPIGLDGTSVATQREFESLHQADRPLAFAVKLSVDNSEADPNAFDPNFSSNSQTASTGVLQDPPADAQKKDGEEPQRVTPVQPVAPAGGPSTGAPMPTGPLPTVTGTHVGPRAGDIRNARVDPGAWQTSVDWIRIGTLPLKIRLGFYVDSLTVIMFFMITMVASLIHLFSMEYMHEELHDPVHDPLAVPEGDPPLHREGRYPRFFTYLSLFCFSMLGLVISDNAFMVFMFWEAVGICSYLLIGFYYERKSASTAANKAFIVNRVGDAGFIVGLMILLTTLGTFNIQEIGRTVRDPSGNMVRVQASEGRSEVGDVQLHGRLGPRRAVRGDFPPSISYGLLTVAGIGIFIGCVGKSAQFPLHVWLPDAMEGPTPVSALIHAATMVAAGVYFVGRIYALFTPHALLVIAYTGGITLFLAGTIALVMTDIKKVLAYSTVSQLGYMMLGLGVGGWAAGLFHLLTHAFFKALLFLGSGSVIHGTGTQEMPKMGGLWSKMPITAATMLVGVLAICGIPYFSGYFSKDEIVAHALYFWRGHGETAGNSQHILLFLLPAAGAAITAFYMGRLYFMTFMGEPRDHDVHDHAHESKWPMWLPLVVLAVPSVIAGYGFNAASPLLVRMLSFRPAATTHLEHVPHEVHETAGFIALVAVLFGLAMAVVFYWVRALDPAEVAHQFSGVYNFLRNKWYFDELYDVVFVRPALAVARFCRSFDSRVLDFLIDGTAQLTVWWSRMDGWFDFRFVDGAVNGVSDSVYATGNWLRRLQTGQLRQYVMFLAVGAVGLFALISFLGADILKSLLVK
jgi:NADH-quinone oxidoreductase subunit L